MPLYSIYMSCMTSCILTDTFIDEHVQQTPKIVLSMTPLSDKVYKCLTHFHVVIYCAMCMA